MRNTLLWVALDGLGVPGSRITPELLRAMWKLSGWAPKINSDAIFTHGYRGVLNMLPDAESEEKLLKFGDGKTFNGRRTMLRLISGAREAGFTHWNFHLQNAGQLSGVPELARELGLRTLGLTELSHGMVDFSEVRRLVRVAGVLKFDGVIFPGSLVGQITTDLEVHATGMRPEGPDDVQPHAVHPKDMRGKADAIIVGSSIMGAENPVEALQQHLSWIS